MIRKEENPVKSTANKFQPKTMRGGNKAAPDDKQSTRKIVPKPKFERGKSPPATARESKISKFSPSQVKDVPVEQIKLPDKI